MSEVSALSVRIGADTADFTAGINRAEHQIKNFQKAVGLAAAAIQPYAAAIVVATTAAAAFGKTLIDTADALNDLAERTGISVERLSQLQYAAHISDVSIGELQAGLNALTKNMNAASQGTGEAAEAFRLLGVDFTDANGNLRSSEDVLLDLADSFSKFEDGTNKNALSLALFSKAGTTLIPFLNQGREGVNKLTTEFDRLGGTLSRELVRNSGEFNDNISRLAVIAKGSANSILQDLLPALIAFSDEIIAARKASTTFFDKMNFGFRQVFKTEKEALADINAELADMGDESSIRFNKSRFESLQRQKLYYEELLSLRQLREEQAKPDPDQDSKNKKPPPPRLTGEDAKKEAEDLKTRLDAVRKALLSESQLLQEKYDEDMKTLEQAKAKQLITEQEYLANVQNLRLDHQKKLWELEATSPDAVEAQKAAEKVIELENSLKSERELLLEDYATKHEMLRNKYLVDGEITEEGLAYIQELNRRHEESLTNLTQQEAQKRIRIEQAAQGAIFNARMSAADAAVGLLSALGRKSKAAAVAAVALNKALSIAQIIQNTAVAQMRALAELGPIAGSAAAAKIGAMGKLQIGLVAATGLLEVAGAASGGGGLGSVGSVGGGGSDFGNGMGTAGTQGRPVAQTQIITIQLQGEMFGREQVRGLISQINEAISDGAQLRLA